MRKKRIILLSCSIILLCLSLIVGGTYALLTKQLVVNSHLQAGKLDVTLTRTALKYATVNEQGQLVEVVDEEDVNFTDQTPENVFGISKDMKIVPGSYFQATMQITNGGDVAFDYSIQVKMLSGDKAFTEQLRVTVTDKNGNPILDKNNVPVFDKKLSELGESQLINAGSMLTEGTENFTVRVSFVDDDTVNNEAQGQTAAFDLIVTATQQTVTVQ